MFGKFCSFLFTVLKRFLELGIFIYLMIVGVVLFTGGVETDTIGVKLKATSIIQPIYVLGLLVLIRLIVAIELKNSIVLICSIFFCLTVFEGFLRLWDMPLAKPELGRIHRASPIFGWEHIPGAKGIGSLGKQIQINSAGFRDTEHPLEKEPDVYRIAVIGDSFTFGMGVDLKDTYAKKLEQLIRNEKVRCEVLNCGVIGYVMWQNFEVLKRKVLPYRPDLVVLGVFLNDILMSQPPYKDPSDWKGRNPFEEKERDSFENKFYVHNYFKNIDRLYKASNRYRTGYNYLKGIEERKKTVIQNHDWHKIMYGKLEKDKYRDFALTLEEFVLAANAANSQVLVTYIPDAVQLHDPAGQAINRFIEQTCQKLGVPFVDVSPRFESEPDPSSLYLFPLDAHTSPKGHQLIAESIAQEIKTMEPWIKFMQPMAKRW